MAEVLRLSEDDVLTIRRRMATTLLARSATFGGPDPLYPARLSSAVQRQYTALGGTLKYTRLAEVGATLFYGIAMGHPFENGNKRTALVSLLVLLDRNRTTLVDTTEDELYNLARSVVTHELPIPLKLDRTVDQEVQALARWIRTRLRRLISGDRLMRFRQLRENLEAFGCSFGKPDHNYIKIRRGGLSVKVGYPRPDFEVEAKEVKRIRRSLQLDSRHGVDSRGFYDIESRVDKFVEQYANLLERLQDL